MKMVAMHQMPPFLDPHVCNKPFAGIENYEEDLKELIATWTAAVSIWIPQTPPTGYNFDKE